MKKLITTILVLAVMATSGFAGEEIFNHLKTGDVKGAIKAVEAGADVNEKRDGGMTILDLLLLRPEAKYKPLIDALLSEGAGSGLGNKMFSVKDKGLAQYKLDYGEATLMGEADGRVWMYSKYLGSLSRVIASSRSKTNSFTINDSWGDLNYKVTYKLDSVYENEGRETFMKDWMTLALVNYKIQSGIRDTMLVGVMVHNLKQELDGKGNIFQNLVNYYHFQNKMGKLSEMLVALDMYLNGTDVMDIAKSYGVGKQAKQLHNSITIMMKQAL